MRTKKHWTVALLLVVVGGVILAGLLATPGVHFFSPDDIAGHSRDMSARAGGAQSAAEDVRAEPETPDEGYRHFLAQAPAKRPHSLKGTRVDGGVHADAQGRLVLEPGIRQMFDYFLSARGEVSMQQIKTWVAHYLQANLPPRAARQGWALFQRYLSYRHKLAAIAEPGPNASLERMKRVIRQRNELRQSEFGPEAAQAFYGMGEAYDDYMLKRRAIEQDDQLSAQDKAQKLRQAKQALPERVRKMRAHATRSTRAMQTVQAMRDEGASKARVHAWRESHLGSAATKRLEKLDARHKAWTRRYKAYRQARAQLDTAGLAPTDRKKEIQRLRKQHFSTSQLKRVRALDHIRSGD